MDDLIRLADTLNFGIAKKQDCKMVGFPIFSKDKNVDKLLSENYTVMIINQYEYMGKQKKRLVTEVLNNSTNINSSKINSYIIGVFFEKYKDNYAVGLTSIDIMTNKLYVYEIGNKDLKIILDETYHFVNSFDYSEIIIFNNILSENEIINRLSIYNINTRFEISNKEYENINIQKKYLQNKFNNNTELDILQYLGITMNKLIINSLINTLNYIEKFNISLIKNCNIPEIWNNHKFLNIINDGFEQLDIISKNKSLIDILNYTSTIMGYRFLKNSLLIPICNEEELNNRYNFIEKMILNNNYKNYEPSLNTISDLEKLHRKITLKKINPFELYNVYTSYKSILQLYELSNKDKIKLFLNDENINSMNNIVNDIDHIFDIEILSYSSLQNIKLSFFKKGFNKELDELEIKKNNLNNFLCIDLQNKINKIFGMENCFVKLNDKETYINITTLRKFDEKKLKTFQLGDYIFNSKNFRIKKNKSNIKLYHLVIDNIRSKYDFYQERLVGFLPDFSLTKTNIFLT